MIRTLQYTFIAIVTISVGFSLYQWNASRAAVKLQQSSSVNLTNGLVGYWSFDGDDVSGTTAYDRSGKGNTGTLTNGPTRTAGRIGQALSFDGTDDYVNIPHATALNFAYNEDFSVNIWVKIPAIQINTSGGANTILQKWTNTGPYPYAIRIANQTNGVVGNRGKVHVLRYDVTNNPIIWSSSALSDNVWHLINFVKNGSTLSLYVDGAIDNTATDTTTGTTTNGHPIYIGREAGAAYALTGSIDEPRIYNRALSANEIRALYDLGNPDKVNTPQGDPLEQGLVGYWKLDDASGTSATDSSGNANAGTLTNGPTWGTGRISGDVVFDGTDDSISTASPAVTGFPFTESLWFKTTNNGSSYRSMFSLTHSNGLGIAILQFGTGGCTNTRRVNYIVRDNTGSINAVICSLSDLNDGVWHHAVAISASANDHKFYMDGILQGSSTTALGTTVFQSMSIGGHAGGQPFPGEIDEVRVYNRVLSDEEVTKLYRETTPDNPDTGLVGYWPMNGKDINGTTAYDRSGKGNTGTLTNGPTRTAGRIGQALNFNGTTQYVSIPDSDSIDFAYNQDFSISFLMKAPSTQSDLGGQYNHVIGKWSGAGGGGNAYPYIFRFMNQTNASPGQIVFLRYDGTNNPGLYSTVRLNDNTWHLVTGTKLGSTLSLYVDGVLQVTATDTTTTTTTNALALRIGETGNGSRYFQGQIDEVRIYNRALSAGEVQSLYDLGNPDKVNTSQGDPLEQGLVGYWKLDDASGTTATDSSGNGSTGTLIGGPTWGTGRIGGDVVFDGVDDYINFGALSALTNPWSLSLWVNRQGDTSAGVIFNDYGGVNSDWSIDLEEWNNTHKVGITHYGVANYASTYTAPIGTWVHLVFISNGTNTLLYVNGTLNYTFTGVVAKLPRQFFARTTNPLVFTNAYFDEVRIYNRALSDEEVTKLYRETTPDNPDTGLVGYWPMNGKDINGTTAYDRSGKGNTGTLTNGPTRTAGKIGQALTFDGTDDYVNGGSDTSLKPSLPISLSYWIKPTTVGIALGHLSFREDSGHNGYWVASANDASVSVNYGDDQGCSPNYRRTKTSSASVLTANQWQHIVAVIRGATDMSIYVNGTDVGGSYSGSGGALVYDGASFLRIGSNGGSGGCPASFFTGSIDEVRIYNRALSAGEITTLYNSGR